MANENHSVQSPQAVHRPYRGRFAPSPTGALHLGGARTALVAWMRARRAQGAFILRVEDLDPPRIVPGSADSIAADLRWLGIDWDEGPDVGGPFAPYVQSQRYARYDAIVQQLLRAGLAYPCTCSRKEVLAASSAPHDASDEGPRYPGTCRKGVAHPERPAAIRFRMLDESGDFVIKRADGLYAYQLAVVVDDHDMQITEVVRGQDLETSTPKQVALFSAIGAAAPDYVHVPLVLGEDGVRLSKRHPQWTIAAQRAAGRAPAHIVSALARSLGCEGPDADAADWVRRFEPARTTDPAHERSLLHLLND